MGMNNEWRETGRAGVVTREYPQPDGSVRTGEIALTDKGLHLAREMKPSGDAFRLGRFATFRQAEIMLNFHMGEPGNMDPVKW